MEDHPEIETERAKNEPGPNPSRAREQGPGRKGGKGAGKIGGRGGGKGGDRSGAQESARSAGQVGGMKPQAGEPDAPPQIIEIRPMARKARMRRRHWGLAVTFVLLVVIPLAAIGYYLMDRATDEYASVTGFSVRQEEAATPSTMLSGFGQVFGGSTNGDTDMLFEFIQSQDLVTAIDAKLDLRAHFTAPYARDPFFALKPGGTVEDLVAYWHKIIRISYDQGTGLVDLRVIAFSPEMAQKIAKEIVAQSQTLVNELNASARADMLKYAEEDLSESVKRLKDAREALVNFRTRTQIVDPQSDLQGRMGVLNNLQQQLAQALVDHDLIAQDSAANDPRVTQAQRRIDVIRQRIAEERANFAQSNGANGLEGYPKLLAEYEGLTVDREFAEEAYREALGSLDVARSNAARQSRYLATFVRPTLAQQSEYPRRWIIFGLAALFLTLTWMILSLMFYAVRDRK